MRRHRNVISLSLARGRSPPLPRFIPPTRGHNIVANTQDPKKNINIKTHSMPPINVFAMCRRTRKLHSFRVLLVLAVFLNPYNARARTRANTRILLQCHHPPAKCVCVCVWVRTNNNQHRPRPSEAQKIIIISRVAPNKYGRVFFSVGRVLLSPPNYAEQARAHTYTHTGRTAGRGRFGFN